MASHLARPTSGRISGRTLQPITNMPYNLESVANLHHVYYYYSGTPLKQTPLGPPGTIYYLSDGLETRPPPYYEVHISISAIIVTGKN